MFGREAIIEVENPSTKKLTAYNGLDVKFNISVVPGNFQWNANISVLNLPRSVVQHYTKSYGWKSQKAFKDRPRVRLSVRYTDVHKQAVCIFDGRVVSANVTPAPNVWLSMTAMSPTEGDNTMYTVTLPKAEGIVSKPVTFKDVITEVCGATKITPVYVGDGDVFSQKVNSFSMTGTPMDLLRGLCDKMSRKMLLAINPIGAGSGGVPINGRLYIGTTDDTDAFNKVVKGSTSSFTEKNGVIGIPNMSWPELHIKTLLRPEEQPLTNAEVSLEHMPFLDGNYFIASLRHRGHLRGGEWVTDYVMITQEAAKEKGYIV